MKTSLFRVARKTIRKETERRFYAAYEECIQEARRLARGSKAHDYNSGPISIVDHFPDARFAARNVYQKALRLVSLLESRKKPKCEAVIDTCRDLVNYAAFTEAALKLEKR